MNDLSQATPRTVFISYARRDASELARRIAGDLRAAAWLDVHQLRSGDTWEHEIEQALDAADVLLALLSPGAADSEYCRAEQLRALRKKKCVIPLLARATDLPLHFEARQYLDFTNPAAYAAQLARLVDDIGHGRGAAIAAAYRETYVTAPPLPLNFVLRPEALASLRDVMLAESGGRHVAVTALEGMGGIGKTILAQALCHDDVVKAAFPDGIAWVTIGREGAVDVAGKMREIAKAIGDDPAHYDTAEGAVNRYRTVLRDKAALVVVDDVWQAQDLEPFRADSSRSRLLFTTRDGTIAAATGAREHVVDLLTMAQARGFLATWAGRAEPSLPAEADDLIRECGRLPLALAMVGAMLRGKPVAFWSVALDLIARADLAAIKARFPDYPHASLFAAIQVSVDVLDASLRERYFTLAVLLEDQPISQPILQSLWNTGAFEAFATAEQLVALSLAQRDDDRGTIRLHDLQVDFVRAQHADPAALKLIHGAMRLSAYVFTSQPDQFASQITGRLLPHAGRPAVRALLDHIASGAPRPWLRPAFPASIAPGEPLLCTVGVGPIHDLAASPDPRRVLVATDDGVKVLDAESFRGAGASRGEHATKLATHPGTPRVLYATPEALISWDSLTGAEVDAVEIRDIAALALSRTGDRVVAATSDAITVWDLVQRQEVCRIDVRPAGRRLYDGAAVAISPDGQRVMFCPPGSTSTYARSIVVHDLKTDRDLFSLAGHQGNIEALQVSHDGRLLISASSDETIRIWSLETGQELLVLSGHWMEVLCVALSPDSRYLVSGSYDQTVRLWEVESGRMLRILGAHSDPVLRVAINADGTRAVSWAREGTMKSWDLETEEFAKPDGHTGFVKAIAFAGPDRMVTASSDKTLKIWNPGTGRVTTTLTGHEEKVAAMVVSADGSRAVSGADDGTLKLWDLETGQAIVSFVAMPSVIRDVAISPDGRYIACGGGDTRLWDLQRNELVRLDERDAFTGGLAFTPDSAQLVGVAETRFPEYMLAIWDVETRAPLARLVHLDYVTAVRVSADGRFIVSGTIGGTITIWGVQDHRQWDCFETQHGALSGLALSPDGRRLVAVSGDCTLSLWDLKSRQAVATFTMDRSGRSCAYGPDGLIVGGDKSGRVYFLRLEE